MNDYEIERLAEVLYERARGRHGGAARLVPSWPKVDPKTRINYLDYARAAIAELDRVRATQGGVAP